MPLSNFLLAYINILQNTTTGNRKANMDPYGNQEIDSNKICKEKIKIGNNNKVVKNQ